MKRYRDTEQPTRNSLELSSDGKWVLFADAKAEIDCLRALLPKPGQLSYQELRARLLELEKGRNK